MPRTSRYRKCNHGPFIGLLVFRHDRITKRFDIFIAKNILVILHNFEWSLGICHSHYTSWMWIISWITDEHLLIKNTNFVTTTCFFHIGGFITGIRAIYERNSNFHVRMFKQFMYPRGRIMCKCVLEA